MAVIDYVVAFQATDTAAAAVVTATVKAGGAATPQALAVGPPLLLQEHPDDVEAGLLRPAHLVEGEPAEVVAGSQGAAVGHKEPEHINVTPAARDVHHRLAELVRCILFQRKEEREDTRERKRRTKN